MVGVAFAGCAGTKGGPSEFPIDDTGAPKGAQTSDTTGGVEGLVVDDSFAPLENVTVRLVRTAADADPGVEAVTDAGGFFAFGLLDPGTYALSAESGAHAPSKQFVQVSAGAVTRTTVTLSLVPGSTPYVDLYQRVGLIECSTAEVLTSIPCPAANGTFPVSTMNFDIPDGFFAIIVETVWQGFSDSMRVDLDINDDRALSSTDWPMALYTGKSPLRYVLRPGQLFVPPPSGQAAGLGQPRPVPTEAFPLISLVSWMGSYQEEINQTARPACELHPLGHCLGVGAALQLRYTNYVSVFVHAAPGDLSAYSAVPDA